MSSTPTGPTSPPIAPWGGRLFRASRPDALQLTITVGERLVGSRVNVRGGELLPDTPVPLRAHRVPGGWVVEGPDGVHELGGRDSVSVRHGELEVRVSPVPQTRFERLRREQGDIVLPILMVTATVFLLQLNWLWALFSDPAGGGGGFEPTPEYIARLLDDQYDGKERGVIAPAAPRPSEGEQIEGFYLPPGHDGPRSRLRGGKNVGDSIRDGEADGADAARARQAPPTPVASASDEPEEPVEAVDAGDADEDTTSEDEETEEDHPIAVHVDEGWGLTDWYDTQDAREDAKEIQQQLELARDILRLDPDNPAGLSIRAYYEYLAFDFDAARRTYERFTELYPDDPAGWNNLALVYKRSAEYEKEEGLYRMALDIAPGDDHALNNLAVCLAHQGRYDEALRLMEQLEILTPDDPYADLHRAKIYAAMGKDDRAYRFLQKSLAGMRKLDTLHNIEFRQDIRVDPALEHLRGEKRFRDLLDRYYGDNASGWWKKITKGVR